MNVFLFSVENDGEYCGLSLRIKERWKAKETGIGFPGFRKTVKNSCTKQIKWGLESYYTQLSFKSNE